MVTFGPRPGIWFVCETVKRDGKKCGTQVEVHIIGEPPDDIYLRHGGCSGIMRRRGAPVEADMNEQDCYRCLNKCGCDAFAKHVDGGPYPSKCFEYELPPDCPKCGKSMETDNNESFYCEACVVSKVRG